MSLIPRGYVTSGKLLKNAVIHSKFIFTDSIVLVALIPLLLEIILNLSYASSNFVSIFLALLAPFIGGLLVLRINAILKHQSLKWKKIFSIASRRYLSALGLLLLSIFFIILGFIFLIIPGFVVIFFLLLSSTIFWIENAAILDAIRTSYELVSKNWIQVFVIFLIITLPVSILLVLIRLYSIDNLMLVNTIVMHNILALFSYLYSLFASVVYVELYYNSKKF